jgi:cytochrome c553
MKALALAMLAFLPLTALSQSNLVQMCAGCHGARGEGNATTGYPRIAGQPQPYLARQLAAYVEGNRENPVMGPIAKQLSPEQREELAAYYSKIEARGKAGASGASSGNSRGRTLATKGDESRQVQACENCHGPGGSGLHDLNPYLAGLDRRYLEAALNEWKDGSRKTDPSLQMTQIGKALSDADIKAIAAYYASQPVAQPARVAAKPSPQSGEKTRAGAGTQERQGTGVTGQEPSGSQGPGGAGTR